MRITIGAQLSLLTPEQKSVFEIQLDQPTPLSQILEELNVPIDMVHLLIINGKIGDPEDATLQDHDHVVVYPYVSGG